MTRAAAVLVRAAAIPERWAPAAFTHPDYRLFVVPFSPVGAVRYHVQQGQRGQFLARFLSPQVARRVQEQGLMSARWSPITTA